MEKSTVRQLWLINDLLRAFSRGNKTTKQLRERFPTKEDASRAIEELKKYDSREAERINRLPVEMRVFAHKEISNEEMQSIIQGGKRCQEPERAG